MNQAIVTMLLSASISVLSVELIPDNLLPYLRAAVHADAIKWGVRFERLLRENGLGDLHIQTNTARVYLGAVMYFLVVYTR